MGKSKTREHRNPDDFEKDLIDLSIVVTRIREAKGISLSELSAMADVAKYIISNIENAKAQPNFRTISKILSALGYSVADAYSQIEAYNVRFD